MAAAKKLRSGPSGKHRAASLLIRLSDPEQKKRWQAKAARARRNLSDWIRVTLDDA